MSKRLRIVIALVAALFAAIISMGYLSSREAELIEMAEPLDIVVAAVDIPQGVVIAADDLAIEEVPARFAQPGYVTDLRDVVDRVALVGILEGEQLTASKVVAGDVEPLANLLPANQRGVTLAVNQVTGVAGLVKPGDYVDVVGIFEIGKSAQEVQTQARFLLQHVLVAAVDRNTGQGEILTVGEDDPQESRAAQTVTLALAPEDAQTLVLAQTVGRLYLLLRSRRDTTERAAYEVLDPQKMLGTDLPIWSPALEESEFQRQLLDDLR